MANLMPHSQIASIKKAIKQKANGEKTTLQLGGINARLNGYQSLMQQVNAEMQAFAKSLAQAQETIRSIQYLRPDVIAGTKGINCLVCGRSDKGTIILGNPKKETYVVKRRQSQVSVPQQITQNDVNPNPSSRNQTPIMREQSSQRNIVLPSIKKKMQRNESTANILQGSGMIEDIGGMNGSMANGIQVVQQPSATPRGTSPGRGLLMVVGNEEMNMGGTSSRSKSNLRGNVGTPSIFDNMKTSTGCDFSGVKGILRPKPY